VPSHIVEPALTFSSRAEWGSAPRPALWLLERASLPCSLDSKGAFPSTTTSPLALSCKGACKGASQAAPPRPLPFPASRLGLPLLTPLPHMRPPPSPLAVTSDLFLIPRAKALPSALERAVTFLFQVSLEAGGRPAIIARCACAGQVRSQPEA